MAKKSRGNGEGSIYRLPNGDWRASVSLGLNSQGNRVRKTKTAKTRNVVASWLRQTIEAHQQGNLSEPSEVTVREFLLSWLDQSGKGKRKETTIADYRSTIENHIIPHLGHHQIQRLKATDIQRFLDFLKRENVGDRASQKAFVTLKSALGKAVQLRLIPFNPCAGIESPRYEKEAIDPFTIDEAKKILTESMKGNYHSLYRLAFSTGMRMSEIFGLEWSDFDFAGGTVSVSRQAITINGKVHITTPKTKSGNRTIRLPQECLESLIELKTKRRSDTEIVFTSSNGKHLRRENFTRRQWIPLLEKLQIRHRGFHHIRHTFASISLGAGVPVHVVSQILGHSRPSTTLDIYAHVLAGHQEAATEAISKIFD